KKRRRKNMKKMILIPAAAGVLAFGGIVLANTDTNNGSNTEAPATAEVNTSPAATDSQNSGGMIGFEKASAIALAIADGKVTDIELSEDDGRQEYEVEIRDAEYEYDFDIDAFTGDVVEQDRELLRDDDDSKENANVNQNDGQQSSESNQDNKDASKAVISADKAKEIALNETGAGNIVDLAL